VENADSLLSFGISNDWSFERDFLRKRGNIPAHFYDHTISSYRFLNQSIQDAARAIFRNYGLKNSITNFIAFLSYRRFFSGNKKHFKKKVVGGVTNTHETTLRNAISKLGGNSIFLKVDIEGFEYEVLPNLNEFSQNIIGLVVEFHHTDIRRKEFKTIVTELKNCYTIMHLHANNSDSLSLTDQLPKILEISFIRTNLIESNFEISLRQNSLISGLDFPNLKNREDYDIWIDV
jgi:hypothetical protein